MNSTKNEQKNIIANNIDETIAISGTAQGLGIEFLYRLRLNKFTGWIS